MIGYEKHPIIGYTEKEVEAIVKTGTHKQLLKCALDCAEFVHHSDTRTRKTQAYQIATKNRDRLEQLVCNRLIKAGYKIQSQIYRRNHNGWNYEDTDLSMTFGLSMHEHPTRDSTNFEVDDLIYNDKGQFINKEELEKKLYATRKTESICQDEYDDLSETDRNLVDEFMKEEGYTLEDISAISEDNDHYGLEALEIEIGNREYYILCNIEDIDRHMRRYLEEDSEYEYFYTQGIEAKSIDPVQTCYSDWLDDVINDGWEGIIGTYDGSSTELSGNAVYYRRN